MKIADKAYIAGFFDGEGCITIGYDKHHSAHLHIVQKNKKVLEWIRKVTKLGTINAHNGRTSKCFALSIHRQSDVKKFIMLIRPYVKTKKKEISMVLPLLNLIISRTKHTKRLSENEIKKRDTIYLKWKATRG